MLDIFKIFTMKKKILITGGSGFIASHVADLLTKKGFKVIIFDQQKSKYFNKKNKFLSGDINKINHLIRATKGVKYVYHFAAVADLYSANENPSNTLKTNIFGTINILEACKINKIKKFIFASSIYALSEQGGFYSVSKFSSEMIIENYAKKNNFKFICLRFGSIYGERANSFNTIQNFIKDAVHRNKILRKSDGNEIRNYIHVLDSAELCVEVLKKKYSNCYLNIFGPQKMKLKKLLFFIKSCFSNLNLKFSKKNSLTYNYRLNPFTYKLRKGKSLRLKKYINIEESVKKLINDEKTLNEKDR